MPQHSSPPPAPAQAARDEQEEESEEEDETDSPISSDSSSASPSQSPAQQSASAATASPPPPIASFLSLVATNPAFTSDTGLFRVAASAFVLGVAMMMGVMIACTQPAHLPVNAGLFVICWSLFHALEFTLTALFNPSTLSFTSFLLNHSRAFHIALLASVIEFIIEWLLWPAVKNPPTWLTLLSFCLVCLGQSLRTAAMYTAGSNFTHRVAYHHRPDHVLLTTGLYGWMRHPSYAGWYLWSVSTQLLLMNPVCIIGYAYVAWKFFASRIEFEEATMIEFFGQEYLDYQDRVGTGIPFLQTLRERWRRKHQSKQPRVLQNHTRIAKT